MYAFHFAVPSFASDCKFHVSKRGLFGVLFSQFHYYFYEQPRVRQFSLYNPDMLMLLVAKKLVP